MEKEKVTLKNIADKLKNVPEALKQLQASALLSAAVRSAMLSYKIILVKRAFQSADSFTYHGIINLHHSYPVSLGGRVCPIGTFECMVNANNVVLEASPVPFTDVVPEALRGGTLKLCYVDAATGRTTVREICKLHVAPDRMRVLEHALRVYNARSVGHQVVAFNEDDVTVRITARRDIIGDNVLAVVNEMVANLLTALAGAACKVYEQLLSPVPDDKFDSDLDARAEVVSGKGGRPSEAYHRNRALAEPFMGMEFIQPETLRGLREIAEGESDANPHDLINAALAYSRAVHMYGTPAAPPKTPEEGLALVAKAKAGEDVKAAGGDALELVAKVAAEDAAKMHTLMVLSDAVKGGKDA